LETLQDISDSEKGIPLIVECLKQSLLIFNIPKYETFADNANYSNYAGVLSNELFKYCRILDKPLIIFFDESDCLSGSTLISFLRQLRLGYVNRIVAPFVHSVALVGMRNIRDYIARVRDEKESLGSASPFNISTEALTLKNFTKEEITLLYKQHTDATGQIFLDDAIDMVFEQTCGQPWLVNAIAREIIVKILNYDYSQTITVEMVRTAIQTIILRRDTQIYSLFECLKEERVRKIIEPMLYGADIPDMLSDDYQYVKDLGLIKDIDGVVEPSNKIYAELIIRALTYDIQQYIISQKPELTISRYLKAGV